MKINVATCLNFLREQIFQITEKSFFSKLKILLKKYKESDVTQQFEYYLLVTSIHNCATPVQRKLEYRKTLPLKQIGLKEILNGNA